MNIDLALVALWLALSIGTKAALLPLFILLLDLLSYQVFITDFPRYCLTSLAYSLISQINITISYKLRYAFTAGAVLYFVGAVDDAIYHTFEISTIYYDAMPYLVIALNAFIAATLFNDGGRNIVGIINKLRHAVVNRCLYRL